MADTLPEFLTGQELHTLTGYARPGQQAAWLTFRRIPHRLEDRRVILSRVHVRDWLEGITAHHTRVRFPSPAPSKLLSKHAFPRRTQCSTVHGMDGIGATFSHFFHTGETMPKRRYSGNDHHFGPFTWSASDSGSWRPWGIMLDSGGGEERDGGCHILFHAAGRTLICELPKLLPDFRIRHTAKYWDAATVARMGRDWYEEVFPREYGFRVSDGTLHLHLGPQTHDSTTTKSKCYFLPWCNWRFIRQSWYGPTGQHIETLWETSDREVKRAQWEWRHEFEKALAKTRFEVEDYDGKRIGVSTHIEEREWRFGTGLFSWLSLFRRAKVSRTLDIRFDHEVGPEKGSWKGGLMGTSIAMEPGELHETAFRRYCDMEHRDKHGKYRIKMMPLTTTSKGGA